MYANVTLHVYQGMRPPHPPFCACCQTGARSTHSSFFWHMLLYRPPKNLPKRAKSMLVPSSKQCLYWHTTYLECPPFHCKVQPYSALPSVVSYGRPIGAYRGYEVKAAQRVAFYHSKQRLSAESRKRKEPSRLGCL